jgi:uncharacterized phage protein gp47/JayE
MASSIQIQSFNQILGNMVRKILADTALSDINAGSVLLTLLEAAASNDFENNAAILNVLELLNIDALKNSDLDAKAADFGLSRNPAVKASGQVSIFNTAITKRSTSLYVIKPAPIAGQTVIYVNSATGWTSGNSLYIGRGTPNFEGPIQYTVGTVYSTYTELILSKALQKDHLISDVVVDGQGQTDILVTAGTIVQVPANNQNPTVQYATLRDAIIPAGEDTITGVPVVALVAGSLGNANINTIVSFDTSPFNGAAVTNTSSFSDGRDIETDVELRDRLKSYSVTLARGTSASILSAVVGVSDPDDSKQVASAYISEPVSVGEPSILYIDDGSGFQPSYAGQGVDTLLSNATGKEDFLQLSNFPVPRPQVVNTASGPFNVTDGSFLSVIVDGTEETVYFSSSQFLNITSATLAEVVVAINTNSTIFKARFANNSQNILLYPTAYDAETIQVVAEKSTDDPTLYINSLLLFPTNEFSYISLYKNSTRLREKAKNATLETTVFASWNVTTTGDLIISVDGTPPQDRSFSLSDFPGATSFHDLSLSQWVDAINAKFAGLTAIATANQTIQISSNKTGSTSALEINGGSYLNKLFYNMPTSATGQDSQFQLNRQTGNLKVLNIAAGDSVSAGVADAKGFVVSSSTLSGTYNVGSDSVGRPANMVVVADSSFCTQRSVELVVGASISILNPSGATMRILSSTLGAFESILPGDYVYIAPRNPSNWLNINNTGLFKVHAKGPHITANSDSYIDVNNVNVVVQSGSSEATVLDVLDIKAFSTDGFPQVWRGSYVSNPPSASISDVVNSLSSDLINVKASVYQSSHIKLTSTTENNGSIAIPVSIGNAAVLFAETSSAQTGNPPHIANRVSSKDLVSFFKTSQPISTNVWLNRNIYTDVKGSLSANSVPDSSPFSAEYGETLQSSAISQSSVDYDSYISVTRGSNRGQFRNVKAFPTTNEVGTQEGIARTEMDYVIGDEFQVVKPAQLSSDDSIVVIMDGDQTNKSIDVSMSRTGRVNSGSGSSSFIPTNTEFSAYDADNEPGIDFSNTTVWGMTSNNTDFSDYAIHMRARNWYAAGGVGSGQGAMIVRSADYGPNGNKLRFSLAYQSTPGQSPSTQFSNTPSYSTLTYLFGSGAARPIAINSGYTIQVNGPYPDSSTSFPNGAISAGKYYDYTFSAGNFATVQVGDVLSIISGSGVGTANSGQFSVVAKSGNTFRVFNPNGSATSPGSPEITSVTTVADVVGTPTVYTVNTVADTSGSLNLKYFIIYDTQGSVAVWYDVNNTGEAPPIHGANRAIKVATVVTGDTAAVVATKTAQTIALDNAFNTLTIVGNQITIPNLINGALASATAGTSGFTVSTVTGIPDASVNGLYFIIYDASGSVAVWYDVNNKGTAEPFHGAKRSIKVSGVTSGMSAANVAAATVAAVNADIAFTASNISNVITITANQYGNLPSSLAGTSGFIISNTSGSLGSSELITNPNNIYMFPLSGNDVATIASTINAGSIAEIVAVGSSSLTILKATAEDQYSYSGNSTALGYGHNPTSSSLSGYIALYDGINWVKSFANANPNFITKSPFILNGVAPSVYSFNTAPNSDSTTGEYFKLVPTSINNIYHQMTQKALSQLPIVANISISDDRRNIQIDSKNIGSSGSIEVVGGSANKAQTYLQAESEVVSDTTGNYLLVKVPAFPDTFKNGDYVKIQNDVGVTRLSRLSSTDTISVTLPSAGIAQYNFNPKTTNISSTTSFSITDVSSVYGRPAGFVWRWQHTDSSVTLQPVNEGDILFAFGSGSFAWAQGNQAGPTGDGEISGFPIISVNDTSKYVDVVNPLGKAMTATAVGAGNTIQICPTPGIKWNLAHAAYNSILSLIGTSGTVTAITSGPHRLNTGDMVSIINSNNLADGSYGPITVTSATTFTFSNATVFSEQNSGMSCIKSGLVSTRYRVEKLGFSDMVRISRYDGQSPRFVDCGVAVDDYVVIGGSTFASSNNGTFRVLSVDNDSIVITNSEAVDELNTIKSFNNKGYLATWATNTDVVTGVAGTFKNVNIGDWVKKSEDPDSYYLQVVSMSPSTSALATQINLGGSYAGTSALAAGVAYDQLNNYDTGIILQSVSDITVFEGDSVTAGDVLNIQDIVNTSWFSAGNIGSFTVSEFGTDGTTYKPYIKVSNSSGVAETNRQISVNTGGFYLTESLANKFYSIRLVNYAVIDELSSSRRSVYMTPSNRSYKFSNANKTSIVHMGKLGYSTEVTSGVDGYLYYTGLLRRVQRIVDGFEPDATNFPGRRAVGGLIETLPPLVRQISIAVNVTTSNGVNLGDITNNIKSVIINYVQGLGVGQDVILSEIIAQVMNIKGVAAVTFTTPLPSEERITIASNERANISPQNIGIA